VRSTVTSRAGTGVGGAGEEASRRSLNATSSPFTSTSSPTSSKPSYRPDAVRRGNAGPVAMAESSWPVILGSGLLMMEESQHFDRSALQALVATAWEEFDGEILLLVRDGSKVRLGASESGGLNARVILSECLRRLNQLEEQPLDPTTRAFVRVVSEELKTDQVVLLIVRGQGDIRLASGAGAYGKVRGMLDDALQSMGGERRRR